MEVTYSAMSVDPNTWEPGAEGDFYKTAQYRIERFFRGRKSEDTRKYAWAILNYLSEKREKDLGIFAEDKKEQIEDRWSWFRSKDLINAMVPNIIPHEITVFRLLEALAEEKLIEKRIDQEYTGKGKKPVYYRLFVGFLLPYWAMSRERLIEVIGEIQDSHARADLRYKIAVTLLKNHYKDPESLIEKRYQEIKKNMRESQREWILEQQAEGKMKLDIDVDEILDKLKYP